MPGGAAFADALRRCWDDGDAVLPLDTRLSEPVLAGIVKALRPSAVVDGSGSRPVAGGEPVADGDALVVTTSGTTREPKGVVLTHSAVEASARATSARLGVDPTRDRWLACLPLSHVGGLSVVTRAMVTATPPDGMPQSDRPTVIVPLLELPLPETLKNGTGMRVDSHRLAGVFTVTLLLMEETTGTELP